MRNIDKLKSWLKAEAIALKELNKGIKAIQKKSGGGAAWREQYSILGKRRNYRHHHIAYCELRGLQRNQIEPHTKKDNNPNEYEIQRIKEEYAWTPEEIEIYKERQARRQKNVA